MLRERIARASLLRFLSGLDEVISTEKLLYSSLFYLYLYHLNSIVRKKNGRKKLNLSNKKTGRKKVRKKTKSVRSRKKRSEKNEKKNESNSANAVKKGQKKSLSLLISTIINIEDVFAVIRV